MIDYRVGDTRDLTGQLDDGSIELVASSPPFLALRSYLPDGHESKHAEIGSEPDPATFLDTLLALTADWGRVLTPYGSIAIELGDTYAGSGGAGGDYNAGGMRVGQNVFDGTSRRAKASEHKYAGEWANPGYGDGFKGGNPGGNGWPRPKSLALIPQLYACSLAYGRNILTGQPSPAGQWLVRNVIVWHRPNPAVGALGDKFRPSTSYIVVATRSPKRWFDLTAVRDSTSNTSRLVGGYAMVGGAPSHDTGPRRLNAAGAPPLDAWFDHDDHDTWTITTQPSRLSHYAMWPAKLAERLILSMCPAEVCRTCGEPRRRIEEKTPAYRAARAAIGDFKAGHDRGTGLNGTKQCNHIKRADTVTLGWTDCGHDNYRPGVALDPFAGTGTTLCVADLHGRDAIGFDIDPRNAELMEPRIAEVRRALFGTQPEMPGQLDMFGVA